VTEEESKDPDNVSSAIPIRGVLSKLTILNPEALNVSQAGGQGEMCRPLKGLLKLLSPAYPALPHPSKPKSGLPGILAALGYLCFALRFN
jgi:hypothetical protein